MGPGKIRSHIGIAVSSVELVAHPVDCMPRLVMDVFEHAFMLDYGLKRGDYLEAFFNNTKWNARVPV
jgi:superoxide dismutase